MIRKIQLRKGKDRLVEMQHPWIFSGALFNVPNKLPDGEIVHITKPMSEDILCTGYYNNGSIAIRVLDWSEVTIDLEYWKQKVNKAHHLKQEVLALDAGHTNAFRLIAGEGDGIPGLIIDVYADHVVIQGHNIGIKQHLDLIEEAIKSIPYYKESSFIISNKGDDKPQLNTIATITENDIQYQCDLTDGQKTGFFLDQKDNRYLLKQLSDEKNVANLFSYTGGFSLSALAGNARQVTSIDISQPAIDLCNQNVELNFPDDRRHDSLCVDVMEWLKECPKDTYDIIVVDPPAFAKSQKKKHNAVLAYKRLNSMALSAVKSKGYVLTFSCSQVVDRELFVHTIRSAAIEQKRSIKILKFLCQSPDHAIDIFHREGQYLKGLLLYVD
jgi:23S rRNA (cytosine1962-C5)-methyltransferase